MKFCVKCGTKTVDGVCPKCAANTTKSVTPSDNLKDSLISQKEKIADSLSGILTGGGNPSGGTSAQWGAEATQTIDPDHKFKNYLMNPKEKIVCILGNNYLQNFLAGQTVSKGFSVVSDKRVYFRGVVFTTIGKHLSKAKITSAVNIRDVTGVNVTYISPIHFIILGILFLLAAIILGFSLGGMAAFVGLVAAAISFVMYAFKRVTLLTIEYAGGSIGFDVKWFSEEESILYQKSLFLAKDKIFEDEE